MTTEQANQLTAIYNEVVQHVGDMVLLWTNSSPTDAFGAQTITIPGGFSSYKYIVIVCYFSITANIQTEINENTNFNLRETSTTDRFYIAATDNYRSCVMSKSSGTVVFGVGYQGNIGLNNSFCIPGKIYGI